MGRVKIASLVTLVIILIATAISCKSSEETTTLNQSVPPADTEEEGEEAAPEEKGEPFFSGPPAQQVLDIPQIDFAEVTPPEITAMRDLVGTWRGTGVSFLIDGGNGQRVARVTWDVTLVITAQNADNTVAGNFTANTLKQEDLVPNNIPAAGNWGPAAIANGRIEGTTLYFLAFGVDDWTLTFTTDLMSGDFTNPPPGDPCDDKAFTLTRQS